MNLLSNFLQKQSNHQRTSEKGVVSVEIAYAFPFLVLIFMVMLFLSDLMLVRHHLNVSINQAARVCTSQPSNIAAQTCVEQWLHTQLLESGVANRCDVRGNVNVDLQNQIYISRAQCIYTGFAPITAIFLLSDGATGDLSSLLDLTVMAPFPKTL